MKTYKVNDTIVDNSQLAFTIKSGSIINIGLPVADGVIQNVEAVLTGDACVYTCSSRDKISFEITAVKEQVG